MGIAPVVFGHTYPRILRGADSRGSSPGGYAFCRGSLRSPEISGNALPAGTRIFLIPVWIRGLRCIVWRGGEEIAFDFTFETSV